TESIAPVEKIVGPAGRFVTTAKMLVSKDVAIDIPAGPSEVVILADSNADPKAAVLDMLSQAEHDPESVAILISTSAIFLQEAYRILEQKLQHAERREIIESSLKKHGAFVLAESVDEAVEFINKFAPEHLELMVKEAGKVAETVSSAGIILLGKNTPVAAADYALGTNHVQPTAGFARIYSGLSVFDYVKRISIVEAKGSVMKRILPTVKALSTREGLPNHFLAVKGRVDND
ncbi:MAG: histidinol dehydrogenase, partial [Candidatus Bathyarchaeia archaeon]